MRNRYAMPVHPDVLKKDFETTIDLNNIAKMYLSLKDKSLKDLKENNLKRIGVYLEEAWFDINNKTGVNLRDREKLAPIFYELNRIFGGDKVVDKAYRGVRLSSFDPNAISKNYSKAIKNPNVLEHLEGLAYGLRSWSTDEFEAERWAIRDTKKAKKDMVIFQIDMPEVVLDSTPVNEYYKKTHYQYFLDTDGW
jgi:hypothetical protein